MKGKGEPTLVEDVREEGKVGWVSTKVGREEYKGYTKNKMPTGSFMAA